MYEAFYGFKDKPFSLQTDPAHLYLGEVHAAAYAMLQYGLINKAGFTVITGEIGSGKTTLLAKLVDEIESSKRVGYLYHTHAGLGQLLPWVLYAFGQDYSSDNQIELYDRFVRFLHEEKKQGRQVILIVDEAQNLTLPLLEELRTLSNVNFGADQLIQLILVGQPELRDKLKHPSLKQFVQRIAVDYHVPALDAEETKSYVNHRLTSSGRTKPLFTSKAYAYIHRLSGGVPRIVNVICDTVLSFGFADEIELIDGKYIVSVIKSRAAGGLLALGYEPERRGQAKSHLLNASSLEEASSV
ncbi:ExeA family protein [Marinobacterium mangrovicola]|uniref:Type II secretory pathway predicted ATPase ExeA n=1 Tax=Marinobacterium mangrovicola TaxID=1476959 RepID=A0A4R1GGF6_9GAMM|nr:AAA family ATPase [Marinobacterium mangrovicola]TCK07547.1 type II secretory pathway predicted ATPase ExeA [Marinobacterium mangrovicola]